MVYVNTVNVPILRDDAPFVNGAQIRHGAKDAGRPAAPAPQAAASAAAAAPGAAAQNAATAKPALAFAQNCGMIKIQ
jgi:hypothetical protein